MSAFFVGVALRSRRRRRGSSCAGRAWSDVAERRRELAQQRAPAAVARGLVAAGITDLADRRLGRCSGGEQQRVRFAMALVPDPALIVLDEPTTGMDVNARRAFWEAIHADAARGRTILFATHYLEEADAWADRVVVMRDGEIVADGSNTGACERDPLHTYRAVTLVVFGNVVS